MGNVLYVMTFKPNNMDILTFRNWKNNCVKVIFKFGEGVKVISFGIEIINTNDIVIIYDLIHKQNILYRYFKNNFETIQNNYLTKPK